MKTLRRLKNAQFGGVDGIVMSIPATQIWTRRLGRMPGGKRHWDAWVRYGDGEKAIAGLRSHKVNVGLAVRSWDNMKRVVVSSAGIIDQTTGDTIDPRGVMDVFYPASCDIDDELYAKLEECVIDDAKHPDMLGVTLMPFRARDQTVEDSGSEEQPGEVVPKSFWKGALAIAHQPSDGSLCVKLDDGVTDPRWTSWRASGMTVRVADITHDCIEKLGRGNSFVAVLWVLGSSWEIRRVWVTSARDVLDISTGEWLDGDVVGHLYFYDHDVEGDAIRECEEIAREGNTGIVYATTEETVTQEKDDEPTEDTGKLVYEAAFCGGAGVVWFRRDKELWRAHRHVMQGTVNEIIGDRRLRGTYIIKTKGTFERVIMMADGIRRVPDGTTVQDDGDAIEVFSNDTTSGGWNRNRTLDKMMETLPLEGWTLYTKGEKQAATEQAEDEGEPVREIIVDNVKDNAMVIERDHKRVSFRSTAGAWWTYERIDATDKALRDIIGGSAAHICLFKHPAVDKITGVARLVRDADGIVRNVDNNDVWTGRAYRNWAFYRPVPVSTDIPYGAYDRHLEQGQSRASDGAEVIKLKPSQGAIALAHAEGALAWDAQKMHEVVNFEGQGFDTAAVHDTCIWARSSTHHELWHRFDRVVLQTRDVARASIEAHGRHIMVHRMGQGQIGAVKLLTETKDVGDDYKHDPDWSIYRGTGISGPYGALDRRLGQEATGERVDEMPTGWKLIRLHERPVVTERTGEPGEDYFINVGPPQSEAGVEPRADKEQGGTVAAKQPAIAETTIPSPKWSMMATGCATVWLKERDTQEWHTYVEVDNIKDHGSDTLIGFHEDEGGPYRVQVMHDVEPTADALLVIDTAFVGDSTGWTFYTPRGKVDDVGAFEANIMKEGSDVQVSNLTTVEWNKPRNHGCLGWADNTLWSFMVHQEDWKLVCLKESDTGAWRSYVHSWAQTGFRVGSDVYHGERTFLAFRASDAEHLHPMRVQVRGENAIDLDRMEAIAPGTSLNVYTEYRGTFDGLDDLPLYGRVENGRWKLDLWHTARAKRNERAAAQEAQQQQSNRATDVALNQAEEDEVSKSIGNIVKDASGMATVDLIVKTATRKIAKLMVAAGKLDIAEMLISKEGRAVAKTVAPAALLGWAHMLIRSDNDNIRQMAQGLLPALETAVAAGLANVTTVVIDGWFLDEDGDMADIRSSIEMQRNERLAAGAPVIPTVKTM